jgi:catechol 2,3-dioxygenase-like lactoylglutathione lyase family enzyme
MKLALVTIVTQHLEQMRAFYQGGFQLSSDHSILRSDSQPQTSAVFLGFSSYWKTLNSAKSLLG